MVVGKIAQLVKVPATKPDSLNSTLQAAVAHATCTHKTIHECNTNFKVLLNTCVCECVSVPIFVFVLCGSRSLWKPEKGI